LLPPGVVEKSTVVAVALLKSAVSPLGAAPGEGPAPEFQLPLVSHSPEAPPVQVSVAAVAHEQVTVSATRKEIVSFEVKDPVVFFIWRLVFGCLPATGER
jgi:hypothetical protein